MTDLPYPGAPTATYVDSDGNACVLDVMCCREPAWAASRLRVAAADIESLRAENERLRSVLARLLSAYDDTYNEDPESQMAVADARAALDGAK